MNLIPSSLSEYYLANLVPGHVVSQGLDLGCCVRCRAKKASQILLKLYFSKPFFRSLMGQGDHWSEWDCKNDQRHPNMYKILTKMFYFQFVGSHRSPFFRSIPFRTGLLLFVIISKSFSNVSKSICLQTFFRSMMGRGEHVTNQDIL